MKKRMLAMFFAVVMACGAAGCGTPQEEVKEENPSKAEQMTAYLQQIPAEVTTEYAMEQDFYTIKDHQALNQSVWDAFMEKVEQDAEASVIVCQYTRKDGAVLDYVTYYEGGTFEVVTDTTRDGYNDEKSLLKEPETYTEMKVFENFTLQEGGTEYTVCALSNDPDLTADEFREYWTGMAMETNSVYMLYVI